MRRVKITVCNNDYFIKTDAEEDYIHQIAGYLNEKVRELSPQVSAVAQVPRPFLLATIRVADDFFRLKKEFEEFRNRAEEESKKLVEMLDRAKENHSFDSEVKEEKEDRREERGGTIK